MGGKAQNEQMFFGSRLEADILTAKSARRFSAAGRRCDRLFDHLVGDGEERGRHGSVTRGDGGGPTGEKEPTSNYDFPGAFRPNLR
jgi:hypothetical protein